IDRIPVMVTVYDPAAKVLRLNPEFARVTGWSLADAAGVSMMERCYPDPEVRARAAQFMQSCREGWMDIPIRTRDGHDVETSWANIRWPDSRQGGSGIDTPDRRRAGAVLRDADRRKDEFLATLAHELRNPLAPIRNSVQILQVKLGSDPELKWVLDVMERQTGQMA